MEIKTNRKCTLFSSPSKGEGREKVINKDFVKKSPLSKSLPIGARGL